MQATSLVATYLYLGKITHILQKNPNTYTYCNKLKAKLKRAVWMAHKTCFFINY